MLIIKNGILSVLAGSLAGIISGTLGVGGFIVLIPFLTYFNVVDSLSTAKGTLLYCSIFPLGLFSMYEYYKKKYVNIIIGTLLVVSFTVSSWIASYYYSSLSDEITNMLLAVYTFLLSVYFLYLASRP